MRNRRWAPVVVAGLVALGSWGGSEAAWAHGPAVPPHPEQQEHAMADRPPGLQRMVLERCPEGLNGSLSPVVFHTPDSAFECSVVETAFFYVWTIGARFFGATATVAQPLPAPTIYFLSRAEFEQAIPESQGRWLGAWGAVTGRMGGPFAIWTWQRPVIPRDPACLCGRITLYHELSHQVLHYANTDHWGQWHNQVGLALDGLYRLYR